MANSIIPTERIESHILLLRGKKVMIDRDLAELYGVSTSRLNEQVRRNESRFPEDFRFRLTDVERDEVVAICDHLKELKFSPPANLPYAFTEHGAIMAASVLNSERAVEVSVYVVRAFVRLREIAATTREIEGRLDDLERTVAGLDGQVRQVIGTLRQLMQPPAPEKKGRMGF